MISSEGVSRLPGAARYGVAAIGGLVLAIVVAQALTFETRYVLVFVVGVLMLAAALSVFGKMRDLLLYILAFNLCFTSIQKTFFLSEESTYVISGIPIGLADLCLLGLYLLWIGRVFVHKSQSLLRFTLLDWCVILFWAAHFLSLLFALSRYLALLEILRLGRFVLLYFYVSQNLRPRNLKWIAAGLLFTIVFQSGLSLVQYRTGALLGIGRTKGASDQNYEQYTVTGFEDVMRAEGTTFDSHALGLFFAMLLPFALALALTPSLNRRYRLIAGIAFLLGVPGLVASFTRAGWVAAVGSGVVVLFCLVRFDYRGSMRKFIPTTAVAIVLSIVMLIPLLPKIRQRLFEAPPELLTARVETVQMGLEMWKARPWTGRGANNYMAVLEKEFSVFEGDPYYIPAHNMLIQVGTELGVVGLAALLCLGIASVLIGWRIVRGPVPLYRCLAAALIGAIAALFIEGLFDPIYVTTVTYFAFWFLLGLGAGLYNLSVFTVTPPRTLLPAE